MEKVHKRQWCEKETMNLIKEIKSRPCIWNAEHEDYNEKYSLATSWEEIASVMDIPELDLRMKWKNLRDAYRKELKKYKERNCSYWKYFDHLRFIMFKNSQGENETSQKETDDETENQQEYEVHLETLGQNEEMCWGQQDPIPDKKTNEDEDFDVMFLKSLTPYLRELGPMRRLVVRSKMQDMLLNEIAAQNASRRTINS